MGGGRGGGGWGGRLLVNFLMLIFFLIIFFCLKDGRLFEVGGGAKGRNIIFLREGGGEAG